MEKQAINNLMNGLKGAADLNLSCYHFECFLTCGEREAEYLSIASLSGCENITEHASKYSCFLLAVKRMMDGEAAARKGLHLLEPGETAVDAKPHAKSRSKAVKLTAKGRILFASVDDVPTMKRALRSAMAYSVASTNQLYWFLFFMLNEGDDLMSLMKLHCKVEPGTALYKRASHTLRKLRVGYRKKDGLHLFSFGNQKSIHLTGKGLELKYRLERVTAFPAL